VASAMKGTGLDATADRVVELLRFARHAAIARGRPVTVQLEPDARRCRVTARATRLPWLDEGPGSEEEEDRQVLEAAPLPEGLHVDIVADLRAQPGIGFSAGPSRAAGSAGVWNTVTFDARGETDAAEIELTSPRDERIVVELVREAGALRIRKRSRP